MAGLYELVSVDRIPRGIDLLVLVTYADCLVDIGRLDFASRVLDEAQIRMDKRDAFYIVHSGLVWARIFTLAGRLDDAERVLRESLSRAEKSGLGLLVTDCKLRIACVLRQRKEVEESRALMTEALREAASENRLYLFRNAFPYQSVLLREIAFPVNNNRVLQEHERIARDHAQRVLDYFGDGSNTDSAVEQAKQGDGIEKLSNREREIYNLLRQGKSRREIADELGIKVNTVRTHARSVYRKLGIHNKCEL